MKQEMLNQIVDSYRHRAKAARDASLLDKSREMDDFADFVEDNSGSFLDDAYSKESELWEEYENSY